MKNSIPDWWVRPRKIAVVVDNPSWVLPWAMKLVQAVNANGDHADLLGRAEDVSEGVGVAFYLGCIRITPPRILARARRNLVVHASDLPRGRGFSPLTWQIIAGINKIPVCLLDAGEGADTGPVVYREFVTYRGDELIEELRGPLGEMHTTLCMRFLEEPQPPPGVPQQGETSSYPRRRPIDSRLDPFMTLASQFDLLRTVDNDRYPAWFEFRGARYSIRIEKSPKDGGDEQ